MLHTQFKMNNIMTQNRSLEVGHNDFIFISVDNTHTHLRTINEKKNKMFPPGRLYFVENTEKINKIYLGNHLALSRTNRGIKIANSK